MEDITLDLPVDFVPGSLTQEFLNKNIRDALQLLLAPPTCIVQKTNTQTYSASQAWTAVSWNTLVVDTEDPANPQWAVGSPTRLVCQTPGWFEVSAIIPMNIDLLGYTFALAFRINGNASFIYAGDAVGFPVNATAHLVNWSTIFPMAALDYVEVLVRMNRAAGLTSLVNNNSPRATFRRIRGT
jgi:hypothetical protein